jgi:hypothetical protein
MDDWELPPDLADLERRLAGRRRAGPPAGLRKRVLAAVGRELNRGAAGLAAQGAWPSLATAAAAALLWINFSMSVANNMDWRLGGGLDPGEVHATAGRIHGLLPELSPRETYRQALLLQAGSRLTPAPNLKPSAGRVLLHRENERWDMR